MESKTEEKRQNEIEIKDEIKVETKPKETQNDNFVISYFKSIIFSVEEYRTMALASLIALPLGALVALVEVVFGKGLALVTGIRLEHRMIMTDCLAIVGLVIAILYKYLGQKAKKGMSLVFAAADNKEKIPPVLVPLVMIASWLTHLCGGSAGREGVAVQIGATLTDQLGYRLQKFGIFKDSRDTFVICGIAAGFAGLFQTPFAAIFFSLEVLVCGELKYKSLFPATIAAFTSYYIAGKFGIRAEKFPIATQMFNPQLFIKLVILGFVFGVAGAFFASTLRRTKKFLSHTFTDPVLKTFVMGAILSALFNLLHQGRYSGFGTEITAAALTGGTVYAYDWILKLVLTILTLSAGFMGGELTPIFSIGSSLGAVIAVVFGLPPTYVAALGYSAMFGSATNTFLAPILIGAEIFGTQNLPSLVVVCAISFFFNFDKTVYGSQKKLKD